MDKRVSEKGFKSISNELCNNSYWEDRNSDYWLSS